MSLPGHLVELPSGRVFVHRRPAAHDSGLPPLVLLHEYLLSHWVFLPVLDRLSAQRSLVLLDLPGHGESDRPTPMRFPYDLPALADTVVQVLDALSIHRAALLGHSFGGAVALTLAARHPARCERLVIVDGTVYPSPLPAEAQLALVPVLGSILFRRVFGKAELRRVMLRDLFRDPGLVTPERVDYYWERVSRAGGREAMHACLETMATLSDDNPDVARVSAPTLIVWGEEDRTVPLQQGRRLAREIAGAGLANPAGLSNPAGLAIIPACGHTPFEERPGEFCAAVEAFLHPAKLGVRQTCPGTS